MGQRKQLPSRPRGEPGKKSPGELNTNLPPDVFNLEDFADILNLFSDNIEKTRGSGCSCKVCGMTRPKSEYIEKHIVREHGERIEAVPCRVCQTYSTKHPQFMKEHVKKWHVGETKEQWWRPMNLAPELFNADDFAFNLSLIREKIQREGGKKFKCTVCALTVEQIDTMDRHIGNEHGEGLVEVPCRVCDTYSTKYPNSMRKHVKERHTGRPSSSTRRGGGYVARERKDKLDPELFNADDFAFNLSLIRDKIQREKGKRFTCMVCALPFGYFYTIERHIGNKHVEGLVDVPCRVCDTYSTKYPKDMRRHVQELHTDQQNSRPRARIPREKRAKLDPELFNEDDFAFNMALCSQRFYSETGMAKRQTKCRLCKTSAHNVKEAVEHIAKEHGDDLVNVPCRKCDNFFAKTPEAMRNHVELYHLGTEVPKTKKPLGKRPLTLDEYNEADFAHNMQLIYERMSHNPGDNVYECRFCDFRHMVKSNLEKHIIRRHREGLQKVQCKKCHFTTFSHRIMISHARSRHPPLDQYQHLPVTDTTPFGTVTALDCGYVSKNPANVTRHILNKHGDFKCRMCGHREACKDKQRLHFRTEHTKVCDRCDLSILPQEKERHVCPTEMGPGKPSSLILSQLKPLNTQRYGRQLIGALDNGDNFCTLCGYVTKLVSRLNRHMLYMHKDQKCEQCNFVFTNKLELDEHVKRFHPQLSMDSGMNKTA